jgi:hypothetical protein
MPRKKPPTVLILNRTRYHASISVDAAGITGLQDGLVQLREAGVPNHASVSTEYGVVRATWDVEGKGII